MNLNELKRRATEAALDLLANDTVRTAVEAAADAGRTAVRELRVVGDEVRRQIDANRPVDDDTASLKERLDRIRDEDRPS